MNAGFFTKVNRLKFYFENQLFKNIDFFDKSFIDIGGGDGLMGLYASVCGASKVIVLEPDLDGSSSEEKRSKFDALNKSLYPERKIEYLELTLEQYILEHQNETFDYILMHNSINHIDESACQTLHNCNQSIESYENYFKELVSISKNGTKLIVSDCSRYNFFALVGLVNPFMKTIEWAKHQHPKIWCSLLEKSGFKFCYLSWSSPNALGHFGHLFFRHWIFNYFLFSHFRLEMEFEL